MLKTMGTLASRLSAYGKRGMWLAAGADAAEMSEKGISGFNFLGKGMRLGSMGQPIFDASLDTGLSAGHLLAAAGMAGSAVNVYAGYKEEGLKGALEYGAWDVGLMSAFGAYGHFKNSGSTAPFYGGAASSLDKWAIPSFVRKSNSGLAKAYKGTIGAVGAGSSLLGVSGRLMTGGVLGSAAYSAMGGGPLGVAASWAGSAMGVAGAPIIIPGAMAAAAATGIAYGGYQFAKAGYRHAQLKKRIDTGGSMAGFMTEGAYTMRSRAVQAIARSHTNARSALGQEANYMHFPSRNYDSRYRI